MCISDMYIISFLLFSTLGFSQVQSEESPEASQRFLAKVTADFDVAVVAELGGRIGSRTGDIITLRLTSAQAETIATLEGVLYMQRANKVQPNLIRVILDIRADSAIAGIGLNSPYTGKASIIGASDWAFDYTQPMFYDTALLHMRILADSYQFKRCAPAPTGYEYVSESQR